MTMTTTCPPVLIALGSNLGDSVACLRGALRALAALSAGPLVTSSFWRTTPVDCPPGSPPFVNAVTALAPLPGETPETLLAKLQALEKVFGRETKTVVNEPRPLDLDLVAWGAETRRTAALVLPHPRAARRRFVLRPLAEIAPDLILPGHTMPVSRLLATLVSDEEVTRLD